MKSLLDIKKRATLKKRKGFSLWEFAFTLVLMAIVIAGLFFSFPELRGTTNRTATLEDMQKLKTLVVSYAGLRKDGQPPATLETLTEDPSIIAEDSIDGADHKAFLDPNKRSAGGLIVDSWGNPYEYVVNGDRTGSITSTAGGGSDSNPIVVNF